MMRTHSGRLINPVFPRPSDIDIADIAHALARQCRFNGHTTDFCSVAAHSVRVSVEIEKLHLGDIDAALWGLLHDAAEAYVGDMISPVKQNFPEFAEMEERFMEVIEARFGLDYRAVRDLKRTDMLVTDAEGRAMVPGWVSVYTPAAQLQIKFRGWDSFSADENAFLNRFNELMARRARLAAHTSTDST